MIKHKVPAISQHLHIKDKNWRKKSCGIASLAMLLHYFNKKISPDKLLDIGLEINAYIPGIGWGHKYLVKIAKKIGLKGKNFDWVEMNIEKALKKALDYLKKHPISASIYYSKDKKIGHLIVLTGFSNNKIFYNDPNSKDESKICKSMPLKKFLKIWKKRIIVIHPPLTHK